MKIKEIRDFKNLPLVKQKAELKASKLCLNALRFIQFLPVMAAMKFGYDIIEMYKKNFIFVSSMDLNMDLKSTGLVLEVIVFCAVTYMKKQAYKNYIQQETIINLEEDKLTHKRTLN